MVFQPEAWCVCVCRAALPIRLCVCRAALPVHLRGCWLLQHRIYCRSRDRKGSAPWEISHAEDTDGLTEERAFSTGRCRLAHRQRVSDVCFRLLLSLTEEVGISALYSDVCGIGFLVGTRYPVSTNLPNALICFKPLLTPKWHIRRLAPYGKGQNSHITYRCTRGHRQSVALREITLLPLASIPAFLDTDTTSPGQHLLTRLFSPEHGNEPSVTSCPPLHHMLVHVKS